jgi:hypothetical protein
MGRLRIPDPDGEPEKAQRVRVEPLMVGDTIEYSLTIEASAGPGQKAWIKFGTTSSVREGETTKQARSRITDYVNAEIDRRIDDLS